MRELAEALEEHFRRWEQFDKTPCVAAHCADGVIELMPTFDGRQYGFKYVKRHPENTRLQDIDPAATGKTYRNLEGSGLSVAACRPSEEALEGAQIVTSCTALRYLAELVLGTDRYENLDMVVYPDGPRDLFGMLRRST